MRSDWLDPRSYKTDFTALKLKSDGGLGKLIEEFFSFDEDEFDKRLAILPKIQRSAEAFKKSKEVVAAGKNALKLAGDVLALLPKVHKKLEEDKREFETKGAHLVDAQFLVLDYNQAPFDSTKGITGYVTFAAPGVPDVLKSAKVDNNGVKFAGVRLAPSGTVSLRVSNDNASIYIEGATDYECKPGRTIIKFSAVQNSKTHTTRAKTIKEATNKTGLKGSVGVNIDVLSVGGEVTSEDAYRNGYEDEVQWELVEGLESFKGFKQL